MIIWLRTHNKSNGIIFHVQRRTMSYTYTVEGNSGDSCRVNHYPVGYYEILGYGIPQY